MSRDPSARDPVPDDPILRALGDLPRESASPGFTARVLDRARRSAPADGLRWPRAAFALAAVLVLVSGVAAWRLEKERRREAWLDQVQAMQDERARLERELTELRAAEAPPILYLGGDDQADLFLDLAELARAARNTSAAQPASLDESQVNRGDPL